MLDSVQDHNPDHIQDHINFVPGGLIQGQIYSNGQDHAQPYVREHMQETDHDQNQPRKTFSIERNIQHVEEFVPGSRRS